MHIEEGYGGQVFPMLLSEWGSICMSLEVDDQCKVKLKNLQYTH